MAAPAFQAAGVIVRDVGSITPQWPAGVLANDVGLLFVETANQAATLTTPNGFVEITNNGTGTAGTSGATRLTVFWCRASGSSPAAPVVADSGDHQVAVIITFRGCITTGNPWDVFTSAVQGSASTAFSIPGVTTTVDETLLVMGISNNGLAAANQIGPAPTNSNLTNIVERADTQPVPVTQASTMLRVGPYAGMTNLVGIGPGGDTGAPYYRIAGVNPHSSLSTIDAQIATADDLDILLFLVTPDSPTTFGANSATGFDFVKYKAKIDVLAAIPSVVDALNRQRAVALIGDEPQHSRWDNSSGQNTWTPTLVNECARYHKQKFGNNCITVMRQDCTRLRNGWDGNPAPAGGWTQLDYGVIQCEGPEAQSDETFAAAYAADKADGAAINVGSIPALNLWAYGVHDTLDSVTACWDYLNNGTSSGVIAGAVQGSPSPYSVGQNIECATWTATPTSGKKTLVCSPAWLRRIIDTVFNDPTIPCLPTWTHPLSTLASQFIPLSQRPDWVAAMDYMVNKGLTRTSANGWRTIKAYIP